MIAVVIVGAAVVGVVALFVPLPARVTPAPRLVFADLPEHDTAVTLPPPDDRPRAVPGLNRSTR